MAKHPFEVPRLCRYFSELSPLPMIAVEGTTHVVRHLNDAFARLAGKDRTQLLGRPFAEAVPEGEANGCLALLDRVYRSGTPENLIEQEHRSLIPPAFWSYAVWAILGEDDHPAGLMIQVKDDTEIALFRKQAMEVNQALLVSSVRQHELTESAENLNACLAASIEGRDRFIAVLGHELRNPLAPIRNGLQILEEVKNDPAESANIRSMMERQLSQMVHLVDDLLNVSRITLGKLELRKERVELATVLHNAVEASRTLIEQQGHELTLVLPVTPVLLDADPARLVQVFQNLLNNAAKYSDKGGHIELVASVEWGVASEEKEGSSGDFLAKRHSPLATSPTLATRHSPLATPELARAESKEPLATSPPLAPRPSPLATPFVVVRIKDSGIGIPAAQLPHVFEIFLQVDKKWERVQGGLGIGLSLVKGFVEMHGGRVEAHSDGLGQGSEFAVYLPLPPPPGPPLKGGERGGGSGAAEAPSSLTTPHAALPTQRRRILVVDDIHDNADTLALLLRLMGHETAIAHDGFEAVAAAETFRPDVVLLDVGLPKMDGHEAARRIRAQPWGQSMVLTAVTGWGQEEDRRRSTAAGFDHHLVKPVDPAALEKLLAELAPRP